jgi:hypothetical protein
MMEVVQRSAMSRESAFVSAFRIDRRRSKASRWRPNVVRDRDAPPAEVASASS